jgi:hypothetical protein
VKPKVENGHDHVPLRRLEPSCLNLAGWTRDEPWFRVESEAADSWAQLFLGNSSKIIWALIGRRRMESRCRAEEDEEETDHSYIAEQMTVGEA